MKQLKNFICLLAAITLVVIMGFNIYSAQSGRLNQASLDCKEGRAILLDTLATPESFAKLLTSHRYIQSEEEASYIARHLIECIKQKRPSGIRELGSGKHYGMVLDSSGFAEIADFPYLSERARQLAGGKDNEPLIPSVDRVLSRKYSVELRNEKHRIHNDTVYLHIKEHYVETVKKNDGHVIDCRSHDSLFASIPVCGKAEIWLPVKGASGQRRYFSALPVERGWVFGSERGTYQNWKHEFSFTRKRAMLPLLGTDLLKYARRDNSILVRSPEEYKKMLGTSAVLFAAIWILAFIVLMMVDRSRGGSSNLEILSIVAFLCGLGLVNLANLQDPLWGDLFCISQLKNGMIPGMVLLILFAIMDWTGIYRYSHMKCLFRGCPQKQGRWMAFGAIIIAVILAAFGTGPQGTRLTLPIVEVQGSPFIKILTICYLAVFFTNRGDLLEAYSRPGKMYKQIAVLMTAILACTALGIAQLFISDLGPFLVLALTALIMFSIYTEDSETIPMLVVTGIFGLSLWFANYFSAPSYMPLILFIACTGVWLILSSCRYERIKISPIILCLVVLLAFHGGSVLDLVGLKDSTVAVRLSGRSEISSNIFNNEVPGGSQIACGIWAITRGHLFGAPELGLASGIPAAHTDLVFPSLIENLGLVGGVAVLICIGMLLLSSLRIGIRNGHPFGFAMASLITMTMVIQAALILLGSLGVIPLTGLTCPFVSYGGTSMALDLACIGILISLSRHKHIELERINTQRHEKVARWLFGTYILLAIVALCAVTVYGLLFREKYMIKEGFFIDRRGERIVLVNPLVDDIKKKLISGDIIDRNGKVLATTDSVGNRIYPYENVTLFTLGDINTKVVWETGERSSYLAAEKRYEMMVKGFDPKPVKVTMTSKRHYSRYYPAVSMNKTTVKMVEDNAAIIPFMNHKEKITEWNAMRQKRILQLTIDAELQKALSQGSDVFVQRFKPSGATTDRTRVSIVIMDALDGALLCSAMCPLPDQYILKKLAMTKTYIYRDDVPGFTTAYTDIDLGNHPLAPGSAVKPLTAGAGLRRFSAALATMNQWVDKDEIIDISLGEPKGSVSLREAIIKSSNIFFIKMLNQYGKQGLYPELAYIYYSVGAGFGGAQPYTFYPEEMITSEASFRRRMEDFGTMAADRYSEYVNNNVPRKLNDAAFQPAWGQGEASVTPTALCRYVAAVANQGVLMRPRYTMADPVQVYRQLLSDKEALLLQECMKGQAANHFEDMSEHIGGKTGTPSRKDALKRLRQQSNDAIYTMFVEGEATTSNHPLAVVIRLERVNANSGLAMTMAKDVVIPILKEKGYIL